MVRHPLLAAALGATVVALPASALYLYGSGHTARAAGTPAVVASTPAPGVAPIAAGLPDFRPLVQAYGPAVVNVSVRSVVKTSGHGRMPPGMDEDNPLFQFMQPGNGAPMRGEGSGFIISADGIILTNAHVVDDAQKVTVKLTDRREFEARVIGSDAKSDVAVLKIDAQNLPVIKLGDPQTLQVGEWVVAIGSPFGLENSVTAGIVSAKGRSLPDDTYVPFIQTDVAVNPGNSGGPLFNLRGEVVGINSQIYSRSGGYQGLSFAIPIDVALNVSKQLQTQGHVTRGKLGVGIQDVDQALAESFGLEVPRGALVASVEKGGPAEKAGLREGDVILQFDGQVIESAGQLPSAVAATDPGKAVALQIWREQATREVKVKLGQTTDDNAVAANFDGTNAGRLGVMVRPLSAEEKQQADLSDGLVVENVDGAAAEAGVRPGDIVLSANGSPVKSVEQLRSVVSGSKSHVALLVQRGDARVFVPVELG
ncbi:MAG: DegQ family serine endoprotease [Proteobacteria bacterium]|nr:DegQ family serine endoprotease [Pseudomonadota bacterium]MBP6107983.1 DegQ family serine endoprotease [Steroidobacteraceae bacterium]MBP7015293.1 DegQ family serine endoprotease [Steroidobacteraceae bacterium]